MKRIGVTGAFGFLGANFIAALLEGRPALGLGRGPGFAEGELAITAFASRTRSNPLFATSRVSIEDLDVLDGRGMARKFSGLDALVHFAGLVDYRHSRRRAVWDCDVLGAKRIFDAALEAGVPKLLHVSSICALGQAAIAGRLADEASTPYGDPSWPISFSRRRRPSPPSRPPTPAIIASWTGSAWPISTPSSRMGAGQGLRARPRPTRRHRYSRARP